MERFLSLLVIMGLGIRKSLAQPIVSIDQAPTPGFYMRYDVDDDIDSSMITPASAEPQIWDFTSYDNVFQDTLKFLYPQQTPYYALFPYAYYSTRLVAKAETLFIFITRTIDTAMGILRDEIAGIAGKAMNDSLRLALGDSFYVARAFSDKKSVVLQLPIRFGDEVFDSAEYIIYDYKDNTPKDMKIKVYNHFIADAWGWLYTPNYDSFYVLRVHEERTFAFYIKFITWVKLGEIIMRTYSFFDSVNLAPVGVITIDVYGKPDAFKYYANVTDTLRQDTITEQYSFDLYFNGSFLYVPVLKEEDVPERITIYSIDGKVLEEFYGKSIVPVRFKGVFIAEAMWSNLIIRRKYVAY
ncbi:MAG: hypothetical protein GXO48_04065 [Chlorobi bacterium]|nr:hypothetical protein [Chlorobiota bacterium]